jgi:hypothetical protein
MAADYQIDTKNRSVWLTYSGYLRIAEMYDAGRRMASDPEFDRKFSQLVAARSVTSVEMNDYTVKKFAQEHVFAPSARRAVVLSQPLHVALARMFQIYRQLAGGSEQIEIFNNMENALRWLGLPS